MTAEKLHDAISLLPADLIAQVDQKRSAPHPTLRWQRYAAMAACFGIIAFSGLWCLSHLRPGAKEAAYDMAMAPMEARSSGMENPWMAQSAEEACLSPTAPETGSYAKSEMDTGNPTLDDVATASVTVSLEGIPHSLSDEDESQVLDILGSLTYDPEAICNCIAPITIAVDGEVEYEINLEEGFVRCAQGQAALTEPQLDTLSDIFAGLFEEP